MRPRWIPVLVLTTLLLSGPSGCGDDDDPSELEAVLSEALDIACQRMLDCTTPALRELVGWGSTLAECRRQEDMSPDPDALQADIDAGRIVFHADRTSACLEQLRAARCGQAVDCLVREVLVGMIPLGQPCHSENPTCQPGLWCNTGRSATCETGTCDQPALFGEPCGDLGDGEYASCDFGLVCRDDTCTEFLRLDVACEPGSLIDCEPGLYCTPEAVCRPIDELPRLGEACQGQSLFYDCWEGACVPADGGAPVCTEFPRAGDACGLTLSPFCVDAYCDAEGTAPGVCQPLQDSGASCDSALSCRSGYCLSMDGTCGEGRELGESCGEHDDCVSEICHPEDQVCVEEYCP